MTRSPFENIEPFSIAPLLSLLPTTGGLVRLESLMSSFYARYEKVQSAKSRATELEQQRVLAAEEAMLRQVLDWLALTPGGKQS